MSLHPCITAALAGQHRRDLITRAESYRLAHAARRSHPAPAHRATGLVKIIQRMTTGRQTAA